MPISIFWFRRDLRLEDNAGLFHALKNDNPVLPLFIFDKNILDELPRADARVEFIQKTISDLNEKLAALGSTILVKHATPLDAWIEILQEFEVAEVFTNRDWEPYAHERDTQIRRLLEEKEIAFHTFKDHVIFEASEVLKDDGLPYTVFTPYSKKWKMKLETQSIFGKSPINSDGNQSFFLQSYPSVKFQNRFFQTPKRAAPSLATLGFEPTEIEIPPVSVARSVIKNYHETRDIPGVEGTSRLSIHFRFGTISIREKARAARQLNEKYFNELIWREFYSQILAHFPQVVGAAFRPEYDKIEWRDDENDFQKWADGKTGFPLVDAGMRELNATGYMHNRTRMVVASFLTKHLLIDWRRGEAYFAEKLLDFDLASNNGGWQWAAGCGTDAAPYFRVFNPVLQQLKFDPDFIYIRKWIPEFGTADYVKPMIDLDFGRDRCLEAYKKALT